MKLTVVDFVYFLKLSLLLRGIFAASLDDEECIESEDSDYTREDSVVRRTSNKEHTETATSIVYIYSPQTSFNSSMGVGHPTTILIASTHIEVVTITPGLVESKESYASEYDTTVAQTSEDLSEITTICSSCSTSTNNNPKGHKHTTEAILSIESQSDNSISAVTFHGSTIAASSTGVVSSHSEASGSSSYNPVSTKQTSSIIDQNSCGTDICLSTNFTSTTTRNVRISSSVSQKSTNSQNSKAESSTRDKSNTTTQTKSSSTKTSIGTTSYHYFDSAGHRKLPNFPFFLALLLIDYISFYTN